MDQFRLEEWDSALQLASQCLAGYEQNLVPAHPFVEVCRLNHALVTYGVGRVDEAVAEAIRAVDGLVSRLGDVHPWALAARLDLAGMTDEPSNVILELCQEFLGPLHPYTEAAAAIVRHPPGPVEPSVLIDIDVPEV
jgi:hypothetical protein